MILAAPVYFGRVAATAAQVFSRLKAKNTLAVLLAVYGNRHYDDALVELEDISILRGFVPVAAGAFVAVHSFDSPDYPMAVGRPDAEDIAKARTFGAIISAKIRTATGTDAIEKVFVPGNRPYKQYGTYLKAPVSTAACKKCHHCIRVCPQGSIRIDEQAETEDSACITCHACVKACPFNARHFMTESMDETYQRISSLVTIRREPEFWI